MDFDWKAAHGIYVNLGFLTDERFSQLAEMALKAKSLNLFGPNWSLVQLILSVHRDIPLATHYRALSRAYGFETAGIEAFHTEAVRRGLLSPWTMNQTKFYWVPTEPMKLGELAVSVGLVKPDVRDAALRLQTSGFEQLGVRVAIGSILLARDEVSYPDFYQLLALQVKVPYVDLETSAAQAFDKLGKQLRS